MFHWRHLRVVATLLFTLSTTLTLSPTGAAAAGQHAARDVTDTPAGSAQARAAAARFATYGFSVRPSDLHVYELAPGDMLIVPVGTKLVRNEAAPGGYSVLSSTPATSTAVPTATLAASWSPWSSGCYARFQDANGWMDPCYAIYKLSSDGDGTRDWYSLHMWATGASKFPKKFKDMFVEAYRYGTVVQAWADWDPGADSNINCNAVTIGVQVGVAQLSFGHDHCETWDITKWAAGGHFKNQWRGALFAEPIASERETAFAIAVSVGQGTYPTWAFNWDFNVV